MNSGESAAVRDTASDSNGAAARVPDFFIVGAPKCGTTAMNHYLRQHPEIYIPPRKEFHYFGSDLDWRRRWIPRDEYFHHFQGISSNLVAGEASVFYLCSIRAAEEIHAHNENARIVVMLRDPMEMVPSQHSQLLKTGNETILDLDTAIEAESDRRQGRRLPPELTPGVTQALLYTDIARYGDQLERYFKIFGPDRVHVILYDDFRADPARTYREVVRFLGVDPDFKPEFQVVNANRRIAKPWLWRLVKFPPTGIRKAWRMLVPQQLRRKALQKAARAYTQSGKRDTLSPAVRQKIFSAYSSDVRKLETLLGRDLSHWLAG